jgi:uncharacterized protein YydD (DUF2326 family)
MRLISLTSNIPSFRTVRFNKTGLNFIVARKKQSADHDVSKTYNGVGKSLLLDLIHFCLGSNKIDEYEKKLAGWEFHLAFEIGGLQHVSIRKTTDQAKIVLDNSAIGVKKFGTTMEALLFPDAVGVSHLSFRSLIPRFMRGSRSAYASFDAALPEETEYQRQLRTCFLLGLETDLITEKHRIRGDQERIREFTGNMEKDKIFHSFFTDGKDVEIEIKDLEDKARLLESKLKSFQIAENYYDIKEEADKLASNLYQAQNQRYIIETAISNIQLSMKTQPDIEPDRVAEIYAEAEVALPDLLIKTLKEVREFHTQLLKNRIRRLGVEKSTLERELRQLDLVIAEHGAELDKKVRFLGAHGALDEFVALSNKLGELRANTQKIRDYKALLETYSNETERCHAAMASENLRTNTYLKDSEPLLNGVLEQFRSFSRQFYPNRPGGLTVRSNNGDNQIRFEIDAKIEGDASDGIDEAKIFCFDMTLLTARHNHNVETIFHDSRLFSDIDPRQRATIFKVAHNAAKTYGVQYIATLNQDQIDSMRDCFSAEEFESIFNPQTIILELTDETPAEKLLGIQVDLGRRK